MAIWGLWGRMAKVEKHITIREDQKREIDERNLNLSGFVRDQLDEWSERGGDE